jgi:hypothetical protein
MKRLHGISLAVAAFSLFALDSFSMASIMTPLNEERVTNAFVIVPPCFGDDFAAEEAAGFAPFRSDIEASLICDCAQGVAIATQQSLITPGVMSASGETNADALTANPTVIHSISSTFYEVSFAVSEAGTFELVAELFAEGGAPVVLVGAGVSLSAAGNQVLVNEFVEPGEDGGPVEASVADSWTARTWRKCC